MNFEKIKGFIIDITGCEADEVTGEAKLKEDLGMDSLDAMEVAMMVRDEMGIEIPEEKLAEIVCVNDIVAYVDSVSGN